MSRESYDNIAAVYATDMGQSMRFDDVGYYRRLCLARGGRTVEFGCGTGRILLPLLASAVDIEGIDQSAGMLQVLQAEATAMGLQAATTQQGLLEFSAMNRYRTLLAPYSVVTYLDNEADLAAFFGKCRTAMTGDGLLVVDTFIPREIQTFSDFRRDYRRPHDEGWLVREKRIAKEGKCNCIERRYTLEDANGNTLRSWITRDLIRPWTEAELADTASRCGLETVCRDFDYGQSADADAQFVILHLRLLAGQG
jgi:SAM-dependent methyltransferase